MTVLNNLPPQLTSFIGREREIAQMREMLETARLLTLTGAGGSGKTRLSIRVAGDLLEEEAYPDGAWFIDLAPLADSGVVPQEVAAVLGVREEPGRPIIDTLTDHLYPRKLLLILDNCEHLVSACAALADALLKACPALQIIATSRQAMGIAGEVAWRVPSLSAPDPNEDTSIVDLARYDSVQLFVARARFSRPAGFSITLKNAPVIVQLCRQLDGIPLAIELAAARVKVLSVQQIVDRLDERFRLLTGGSPTALPRQQTLQALMDWSYDLLSEEEQVLLRGISVFQDGFTLEAVLAVCGTGQDQYEMLDLLSHLVDKSLVLVEDRAGVARYRLLETIRQHAWEKLNAQGESERIRTRHREWYADFAERAYTGMIGGAQNSWFDLVETEHDNVRAALDWSIRGDRNGEAALRISSGVWRFWDTRGYITEGRHWLDEALSLGADASPVTRSRALSAAGNLAYEQGDFATADVLHTQALELRRSLGDRRGEGASLANLGVLARSRGNFEESRQLYEESLAIFREIEATSGIATVLNSLGFLAQSQSDYARAEELYCEALAYAQEMGDDQGLTIVYNNLGEVALCKSEYDRSYTFFKQALEIAHELRDKVSIIDVQNNLGGLESIRGNYGKAIGMYRQSLELAREIGHKPGIIEALEGLAAAQTRDYRERALQLFGATEALREKIGAPVPPHKMAIREQNVARARKSLGEKAINEAWGTGRLLTLDAAIELALRDAGRPEGAHGDGREPDSADVPLTPRERQVLQMVAQGLTDAAVASKLTLSSRTVNAHMQSIFNKLGVTSRNAATRWAIERGLAQGSEDGDDDEDPPPDIRKSKRVG